MYILGQRRVIVNQDAKFDEGSTLMTSHERETIGVEDKEKEAPKAKQELVGQSTGTQLVDMEEEEQDVL